MRNSSIGGAIVVAALVLGAAVNGGYVYVDGISPVERHTVNSSVDGDTTLTDPSDPAFREKIEKLIHQRVNDRRQQHGVGTLGFDVDLRHIARNHSRVMATTDTFAHVVNGDDFTDRYEQAGYRCSGGGENIAWTVWDVRVNPNYGDTVVLDSAHDVARSITYQWMNSTGHRENILRNRFDVEGVGIYYEEETGRIYATQNFC